MKTINHTNVTDNKVSIAYQGVAGAGKTHAMLSWPKPMRILQPDPNRSTVTQFMQEFARAGLEVVIDVPDSWDDMLTWARDAKARKFAAQTIGVDTYSIGSMYSEDRFAAMDQQVWGRIRGEHLQFFRDLTSCTAPIAGLPSYHVVVNVHTMEVKERVRTTNDKGKMVVVEGRTVGVRPAIAGSAKDFFNRMFSCSFVLEHRAKIMTQTDAGGRTALDPKSWDEFVCWTQPPTELYETKDEIGGKNGLKRLPARLVDGTYPSLCKAWGVTPDPDVPTLGRETNNQPETIK